MLTVILSWSGDVRRTESPAPRTPGTGTASRCPGEGEWLWRGTLSPSPRSRGPRLGCTSVWPVTPTARPPALPSSGSWVSENSTMLIIQWNLSNPTCTGREILCWNRQGVGLHSGKHIRKLSNRNICQMGMKINFSWLKKLDYTCVA